MRAAIDRSRASAAGVSRSWARRTTNPSSTMRSDEISASPTGVSSATHAPRRGIRCTRPSSASRASASRTGMCDTPSWLAIVRSTSFVPGR